jgi:uncharacterized protein
VKTVDTNVLVYAHREEFPQHATALKTLTAIATAVEPWVLLWPCLYEFVRVVTHPKVFDPPTPLDEAVAAVEGLLASPSVLTVSEGSRHPIWFARTIRAGGATGNLAFDAHIAALMREHAIDEIVTADRDFHRFPGLRISNPFQDVG